MSSAGLRKCLLVDIVTTNTILYCCNWEQTVHFYRHGLGLPVHFANDWFVEFGLTATSRLSIADETRASINSCGGAGITVTLQVGDIEAARERALKRGLKPTEIQMHAWNARVFYLFDPEGYRLEMWQIEVSGRMSKAAGNLT